MSSASVDAGCFVACKRPHLSRHIDKNSLPTNLILGILLDKSVTVIITKFKRKKIKLVFNHLLKMCLTDIISQTIDGNIIFQTNHISESQLYMVMLSHINDIYTLGRIAICGLRSLCAK